MFTTLLLLTEVLGGQMPTPCGLSPNRPCYTRPASNNTTMTLEAKVDRFEVTDAGIVMEQGGSFMFLPASPARIDFGSGASDYVTAEDIATLRAFTERIADRFKMKDEVERAREEERAMCKVALEQVDNSTTKFFRIILGLISVGICALGGALFGSRVDKISAAFTRSEIKLPKKFTKNLAQLAILFGTIAVSVSLGQALIRLSAWVADTAWSPAPYGVMFIVSLVFGVAVGFVSAASMDND